ncbi:uncharacterized protein LOC141696184 [Apium graveolens]|uniref:uncharacterized protein LOC141696184 n=1 Tax=Apium graveolens TaxID=4045 RepID=UPI003D7A0FF4
MAATAAACKSIWLQNVLSQITGEAVSPVIIYVDNKSAINLAKNPVFHGRSKHIDVRFHFIRECIERGEIEIKYIASDFQRADIMTKALCVAKFEKMRKLLGVLESEKILNIVRQEEICGFCTTHIWAAEFTGRYVGTGPKGYSICCGKGKVQLPLLRETPPELNYLIGANRTRSSVYFSKSRVYNNIFAFCSFGGNVDHSVNNGKGPYIFRVCGRKYHSLGSLTSKFAQLYMYDGQEAVDTRLSFTGKAGEVDPTIVSMLQEMLERENALVSIFKHAHERFTGAQPEQIHLRLFERRTSDGRFQNVPTANDYEFAGLVVDNDFAYKRDVVVEHKKMYPLLFPFGEDGYRINIKHRNANNSESEKDAAVRASGSHSASVRPDIVARVFKMKLNAMLNDFTKKHILGRVLAVVYTVEFQKWGLPQAHIVLWLGAADKLLTPEDIDNVISVEIADKKADPIGYKAVSQLMMHGPCGPANPKCPCMSNGRCTKLYPKSFSDKMAGDADGYALYRRRDTKVTVEFNRIYLDNRHVVPYHRGLLVKYQGHINEVRFRDNETLSEVVHRVDPDGTMFIQWMLSNRYDNLGHNLTFIKYPTKFRWDASAKHWFRQK